LIYGTGVDVCSIERLEQSLQRTENLGARLFHENEIGLASQSLAARFAAKEALAKALGTPAILTWNEIEVVKDSLGKPSLLFHGKTKSRIDELGELRFHLSMSHDGPVAVATVVVESI